MASFIHRWRLLGSPFRFALYAAKLGAAVHLFCTRAYSWGAASGPSMLPTVDVWGESMVVSRFHRNGIDVQVGDLVMYKIPTSSENGVKRVLGLPGDYVLMNTPESGNDAMIQIPKGHCWLVGDNLTASRDSRMFGPVPLALIKGKCIAKGGFWPWSLKRIQNPLKEPAIA